METAIVFCFIAAIGIVIAAIAYTTSSTSDRENKNSEPDAAPNNENSGKLDNGTVNSVPDSGGSNWLPSTLKIASVCTLFIGFVGGLIGAIQSVPSPYRNTVQTEFNTGFFFGCLLASFFMFLFLQTFAVLVKAANKYLNDNNY